MKKRNIILFGASEFGKKTFERCKNQNDISIIAFCDNDANKHNTKFLGVKVVPPLDILNLDYDEVIISSMYDNEISEQLLQMGIKEDLISVSPVITNHTPFGKGKRLEMAHELLFYACDLFNQNNIEYHIDHGTLLGIVRDDTLLPWDKDVDFAMPSNQLEKTLDILKVSLKNFKSIHCKNNNWSYYLRHDLVVDIDKDFTLKPVTIKIFNDYDEGLTNGFDLDIKFKYEYHNKLHWNVGHRTLVSDQDVCFPSSSIEFKNCKLKLPRDVDKYLISLYGNWKVPNQEWTYRQYNNINS